MTLDWLNAAATQKVLRVLADAGHTAYVVGGCVRNSLMGLPATDIDIATSARPEDATASFERANLKVVPTGLDHGTITVVCDGTPFEITTFRKDIETDGRHAVVQFSDDVKDDARRRDFTINALYMDAEGHVVDPLGGREDITACRVRFIDDPDARVREDYLRILRFFRFHALYADPTQGFDSESLAACARGAHGLAKIAKERIGQEMVKLLGANDPAPAIASMRTSGVLAHVIDGADDTALAPFVHLSEGWPIDPIARLAAIGGQDVDIALRLSKAQSSRLSLFRDQIGSMTSAGALGYMFGEVQGKIILALRAAIFEAPLADLGPVEIGAQAIFPISAKDLMPDYVGPTLGKKLKELTAAWIASGFSLTRQELLESITK